MFFNNFPTVNFKINGRQVVYQDIYRFVNVNQTYIANSTNYDWYEIASGERPDHVSYNMYGTTNFHWTFFIINDSLKQGISSWPLSDNNLEQLIHEKYGKYGVITIRPVLWGGQNTNVDLMDSAGYLNLLDQWGYTLDCMNPWQFSRPLANLLHGIDLSHPKLRIRRVLAKNKPGPRYAKIARWDPYKYQLWITDSKDPFFFRTVSENVLFRNDVELFLLNPTDEEKEMWKFDNVPGVFFDEEEGTLRLTAEQFFGESFNAPDHYVIRGTDTRFEGEYIHERGGTPVSYLEKERELNEQKRKIRVIKPELIYDFVEMFKSTMVSSERLEV